MAAYRHLKCQGLVGQGVVKGGEIVGHLKGEVPRIADLPQGGGDGVPVQLAQIGQGVVVGPVAVVVDVDGLHPAAPQGAQQLRRVLPGQPRVAHVHTGAGPGVPEGVQKVPELRRGREHVAVPAAPEGVGLPHVLQGDLHAALLA